MTTTSLMSKHMSIIPYSYPRGSFDQGEGTKSYSKENNKAKLNLNKQKHLNGLNGLNGDARYHVTQCATNQTNAKSKEDSNCAEGWDVRSFNKNYNCSENFTQSKGNYFQDKRKYSKQSLNSKTEEVYPNNNYNCSQVEIIAENNKSNTTNTKDKKVYLKSTRKIEIIESNQQKTNKEILIVPREEELQKEPQTNKYKSKSFKKNKKGKYIDVYSLALEDKEFSKENQKKVKKSSGKVICVEVPYPNDTILKDELGVSKEHDSKTKEEQMKLHNSNAGNISVESNNEKEDKLLTTPSIPCINERPAIESPKRDDYTSSLTSKLDLNTQVNLPDSRVRLH